MESIKSNWVDYVPPNEHNLAWWIERELTRSLVMQFQIGCKVIIVRNHACNLYMEIFDIAIPLACGNVILVKSYPSWSNLKLFGVASVSWLRLIGRVGLMKSLTSVVQGDIWIKRSEVTSLWHKTYFNISKWLPGKYSCMFDYIFPNIQAVRPSSFIQGSKEVKFLWNRRYILCGVIIMQFVTQGSNAQTDLECIPDITAQLSIKDTLGNRFDVFAIFI